MAKIEPGKSYLFYSSRWRVFHKHVKDTTHKKEWICSTDVLNGYLYFKNTSELYFVDSITDALKRPYNVVFTEENYENICRAFPNSIVSQLYL